MAGLFVYGAYLKVRSFFRSLEFEKKHLRIDRTGGSLHVTVIDHDAFVSGMQERINSLRNGKGQLEYLYFAFEQALRGCTIVRILKKGSPDADLTFWTNRGKIRFEHFLLDENKRSSKMQHHALIGLLVDLGFVEKRMVPLRIGASREYPYAFKLNRGVAFTTLEANFRKDSELAARFAESAMTEVYGRRLKDIFVELG